MFERICRVRGVCIWIEKAFIAWPGSSAERWRIAFPEGEDGRILRACSIIESEGIAKPILLGRRGIIAERIGELGLDLGDADSVLAGITTYYPDSIRPAIRVIGTEEDFGIVAGMYMLIFKERVIFFADTTVNIDPTAEELASIAQLTARYVHGLGYEPRIAMLSFSTSVV
ncbi:hypothetical protein KAU45_03825 [bacterium]|nr:hypothetical protein [bacterium]